MPTVDYTEFELLLAVSTLGELLGFLILGNLLHQHWLLQKYKYFNPYLE
jgi:hypothetical protein